MFSWGKRVEAASPDSDSPAAEMTLLDALDKVSDVEPDDDSDQWCNVELKLAAPAAATAATVATAATEATEATEQLADFEETGTSDSYQLTSTRTADWSNSRVELAFDQM